MTFDNQEKDMQYLNIIKSLRTLRRESRYVVEEKVCGIFHELGVELGQRDIQACHRIKNNETVV